MFAVNANPGPGTYTTLDPQDAKISQFLRPKTALIQQNIRNGPSKLGRIPVRKQPGPGYYDLTGETIVG